MVQKRSLVDEELCNSCAKHSRQFALNSEIVQCLEFDQYRSDHKIPITPGDNILAEFQTRTSDIEISFNTPFVPAYFDHICPIMTPDPHEEVYSSHLEHPPLKPVPIGNGHQANIPTHGTCEDKNLMGICVIPMPDYEQPMENDCNTGNGRTDCICDNMGSVRCVRQHIMEARDKLKTALGQARFLELGFGDMGEEVAQKWSAEEEEAFNEVVFSNPPSFGNSFWDGFSTVFPNRAKKDIISYYFNVFMLRRRAEQNRCDPMNIDSDNDELHESDDYNDDECEIKEEDEDSIVESSSNQDGDVDGYNKDAGDQSCFISGSARSCKSFEPTPAHELKDENGDCWSGNLTGYVLEPCDSKIWDMCCEDMTTSQNKVDFLPTYTVIEEVFGDEDWNLQVRNGKGVW